MKHSNSPISGQKGSISGAAIGLVVLALVILGGVAGWWYYKNKEMTPAPASTQTIGYQVIPPVVTVATTTVYKTVYTPGTPTSPTGVVFHDSTYGLTLDLPADFAGYRSYVTTGGPANLSGTEEIHFVAPGEAADAFVVNIFSKQQWNNIRTQENLAHENVNDLGEGNYMGENKTWIYSYNISSHQTEIQPVLLNAVFY